MNARVWIFGEVLFDHFPDGKRVLGGAPFNVAWHLQAFRQAPRFISRVGADPEGATIRAAMRDWGMDTGGLQVDAQRPTGRVSVRFADGEPHYDIVRPCAYDAIEPVPVASEACRVLYHGTLALRDATSRQTVTALRANAAQTVFVDVNLRAPWWEQAVVLDVLHHADWVKLNADELALLSPTAPDAAAFLDEYELQGLVLTRGGDGAEVLTANGEHCAVRPRASVEVVDTVGAGDAFAAVMILGLTNDWSLALTLRRAQAFASSLVGQRGATVADPDFYQRFIDDWQLER